MKKHLETHLAHIQEFATQKDPYGASHFPIYNTGTFDLKKQDGDKIYDYTRSDNPTREVLENLFTKVENGAGCVCTHTGIASVALLFETVLKANSHILVEADCYGGTFRLLKIFADKYNVTVHFANFLHFDELEDIKQSTAGVTDTFKDIKESMNKVNDIKNDPLGVKKAITGDSGTSKKTEDKGEDV